jgi:AcrR family transcriptional regulator
MTSTDTSPPLRADARRNRERILEAARRVFGEHGASTQIVDVATEAGVGVGTLYRHFPNKQALFTALVAEKFALFNQHAETAAKIADPWEAFAGMLRAHAEAMVADASVREVMARVPQELDAEAAQASYAETAERIIARAVEAGALRDDFTRADIPMVMCGVTHLVDGDIPGSDWRRLLEFVLDGLRAR